MRGLFRWAVEAEYVAANPCAGVKLPRPKNAEGFAAWTEDNISRYKAHWPLGTKERVWLDVLLYTGLRRGDAVRIGRQHIRNGIESLKTEKSGYQVEVRLPILPVLQATLAAGPTADLTFICGASGHPLTKESFGNLFRRACNEAGVQKSAHGIRKIAATRAAERGATVAQLKALFGWTSMIWPAFTHAPPTEKSSLLRQSESSGARAKGELYALTLKPFAPNFLKAFQNQPVREVILRAGTPKGNRTPVSAVRGRRPRPLDDGRALSPVYPALCQIASPLFNLFMPFRTKLQKPILPPSAGHIRHGIHFTHIGEDFAMLSNPLFRFYLHICLYAHSQ